MIFESEQSDRPTLDTPRRRGSVRFISDSFRRKGPALGRVCTRPNPLWLRGVPSMAWVQANADNSEWLGYYLERIHLVVVDPSGMRGPCSGDPLEEAACVELSRLVEPMAVEIEQAYLVLVADGPFSDIPEDPARAAQAVEEFESFLEWRDLGGGRLVVALGYRAPADSLGEGRTSASIDLHHPRYNFDLARDRTFRDCAENPNPLWLRGVPSLAWVEPNADNHDWLGPYLWEIRLIVVDRSGVRGPHSGDPLEEATCVELSKLVEPKAAAIREAYRAGGYGVRRTVVEFESFLERRDLGDGRLLVALGYRTPHDFLEDGPTPDSIDLRGPRYSFDLPRWWHGLGEDSECPNPLWLIGVPSLEWVEATADNCNWLGPYLQKIRLVVVDKSGVRVPCPSDPLEEAACVELSKLIEPSVAELNQARWETDYMLRRNVDEMDGGIWGEWVVSQVREKQAVENFQHFLEVQAISNTRFVVALGCEASADALAELRPPHMDLKPVLNETEQ